MPTKHLSTRAAICGRGGGCHGGHSAVEQSSYIDREEMESEYDGKKYYPKYSEDLVHCEVMLPPNAPRKFRDPAVLWNNVEMTEKGDNAQLARTFRVELPNEWSYELAREVMRDYIQREFVDEGMCVQFAIHDSENKNTGQHNLHCHMMMTLRSLDEEGEWMKKQKKEYLKDENGERIPLIDKDTGKQKVDSHNRKQWKCKTVSTNDWSSREKVKLWRTDFANTINAVNARIGKTENFWEHRSFKEQGLDIEPQIHLGEKASALERAGIPSIRGNINREIIDRKSSVGFRKNSKWNKTGIVFFCTEKDAQRIHTELQLPLDDNSTDASRPYAVFVRDSFVADVVRVLKMNPANIQQGAGFPIPLGSPATRKGKDSYQNRFWDEYFPHVKSCLARDGYSSSDSNTETTVRDTFYLERKDSRDFLSWFESKETVEEAKKRVIELLTAAARRSSNLKNDIKYYSRDIDYFAEFYWKTQGKTYEGSTKEDLRYVFVRTLKGKSNVSLVSSSGNGNLYVRKEYSVYNADVFKRIKAAGIDGIPELIEINEVGNRLYTIEQYISGDTLLEIFERKGPLDESMIRTIAIELCRILKRLHSMDPQVLHRDIKPSNIMLDMQGKVYLIDFNASKEVHGNTSEDTVLYGTQYFAAPEQLIGYMASSPATDIFSLGATLSYLMTGMYHSQMIAPGRFKKVLTKCVEMSPKDRYQSVEEFEQAFLNA